MQWFAHRILWCPLYPPVSQHDASLSPLHGVPKGSLLHHTLRAAVVEQRGEGLGLALVPAGDQAPLHRLNHPGSLWGFSLARWDFCGIGGNRGGVFEVGVMGREKDWTVVRAMCVCKCAQRREVC